MFELNKSGEISFGDNYYTVCGLSNDCKTLSLWKTDKSSIYYTDHKTTEITRKISKEGTIRLEGTIVNVMKCEGMEFHINEAKKVA